MKKNKPIVKNPNLRILVINSGLGNIGSLINALEFLKFNVIQIESYDSSEHLDYDGFVLPGVGSFPVGIKKIKDKNLDKLIYKLIDKEVPGLGICLGMQFLAKYSFEGGIKSEGLNIFEGNVERLNPLDSSKVPHVGWTETKITNCIEPWQESLNNAFYYVHSYVVNTKVFSDKLATINYGNKNFVAAIYRRKILGVQFHPEKSQQQGLKLLKDYFLYQG